ncbi:dihydroorotase [Ethanoligenens sp.]|uniref:dihydroorotase n=1 Tax=Ethanoligenens sp. TaxID=2099655 RepID=UPI0039E92518
MNKKATIYDLVIRGNLVLPDTVAYGAQLAVKDGVIDGVFDGAEELAAGKTVDASGCFVLPGAIDAHVHCFSSLAEGFTNATNAAACGGVTTVIEMPYDADGMICTEQLFTNKKKRMEGRIVTDMALLATIKNAADGLSEIDGIVREGACGFKMSMFNTNAVRFPKIEDSLMFEAFCKISEKKLPVGLHAENDGMVRHFIELQRPRGTEDPKSHCLSRPKVTECTAVALAMELGLYSGVKLHIYHGSFPHIFEIVNSYKAQGAHVTAETCPHYLCFHSGDMDRLGARIKINPPVREESDCNGLWNMLARDAIDIVTSDHAPWTPDKKSKPDIFENASGAPGVETLLPVLYSEGVAKGRLTVTQLARHLSARPAEIFGLDYCKGSLEKGKDADLAILDPSQSHVLDETKLHSSAMWSPYNGFQLQGAVTQTYVRGNCVYYDGTLSNKKTGRFVPAKHR